MAESNTPEGIAQGEEQLSETQMAAQLSELITGQVEEESEDSTPETKAGDEKAKAEPESEVEEDELSFLDDEDEGGTDDSEEDDASEGGDKDQSTYAAPTDIVKLSDGTETTVEDLMRGSLREADYQRKTQELAESRKTYEAQAKRVQDAEDKATEELQTIEAMIASFLPQMPDPSLAQSDPFGYQEQRAQHDFWQDKLKSVRGQLEGKAKEAQEAQLEEFNKFRASEADRLFEKRPHLKDPKKQTVFFKEAGRLLVEKYGVPAEELPNLVNHQVWMIAEDALRWERSQKKKMAAVRKGKGKPAPVKPGRRVSGKERRETGIEKRLQQAEKSGSTKGLEEALGAAIHAKLPT